MKHPFLLLSASVLSLGISLSPGAQEPPASDYIQFATQPDADSSSDCSQRGGMRVFVINAHPSATIDLHIDRFFSRVRQAGRSMFALASGHRQPLGCNIVMDSKQRWELIRAEFIAEKQALERYGQIN